jgi:hypothetical protein
VSAKPPGTDLVEATPERYVLDIPLGRVIVEPDGARFLRNGRGRGLVVIYREGWGHGCPMTFNGSNTATVIVGSVTDLLRA